MKWVKEGVKRKIRKYLEMNKNEDTAYHNYAMQLNSA